MVAAGEDPRECAVRELAEELGIAGAELTELFTDRYEVGGIRCHAHAYEVRWDGPITHQPDEVADGWWVDVARLRVLAADEDWPIVPDGRQLLRRWLDA